MRTSNRILKIFLQTFVFALVFSFSAISINAQDEDDEDKQDPVKLFEQAQDEHEKGNLLEAIKLYDEAIKLAPEFPEAEYQRASALVSLKRFDEAEKGFRRAIELRSNWSLPYGNLGSLLVQLNRFKEAEPILIDALKLDAKNFPALVAMVELRLRTKASKEQLDSLLEPLRAATGGIRVPVSVWMARSTVERATGNKENAKLSLDRALMIEPKNFNALIERASLYEETGDYERAITDLKTAQTIEPKNSSTTIAIARIYSKTGKNDEAIALLDSLDEKAKNTPEAQSLRASLMKCDSSPETRAALENILLKQTRNASILACLGYSYRTVDPIRSMDFYRMAVELEPNNIGYATGYAAALVQAKRFENAIVILSRILTVAPDDYVAHANLATALYELKRYPEALIQFGWIAAAKPEIAVTYFYIATIHDYLQEYKDALVSYEKFLSFADAKQNQLEIEKVNLRLPSLKKQISRGEGKKKK
jgi:tetratricopeptide (TPR) repeat protein